MWRSLFLALGIYAALVGLESIFIDRAMLNEWVSESTREIAPEPWMSWMLLSAGVVVMLYSLTLRRGTQ